MPTARGICPRQQSLETPKFASTSPAKTIVYFNNWTICLQHDQASFADCQLFASIDTNSILLRDIALAKSTLSGHRRSEPQIEEWKFDRQRNGSLDALLLQARTFKAFEEREVEDELLMRIYDFAKFGLTSFNPCPKPIIIARSPEAKGKVEQAPLLGNIEQTRFAPVVAIMPFDMNSTTTPMF